MNVLVDTHIFLWALSEPERLSDRHRQVLISPANRIFLSSVSIAELMIKHSIGKLNVNFDPLQEAQSMGFDLINFSASDAVGLRELPYHHRDPFDRMIIVQAVARDLKLLTEDSKFLLYEVDCIPDGRSG